MPDIINTILMFIYYLFYQSAVMDLSRLTDQKAELIELLSLRDTTQKQLQELQDRLHTMAVVLGEPKVLYIYLGNLDFCQCLCFYANVQFYLFN